jgi:tetratricopeptide (TPR) repeat protein
MDFLTGTDVAGRLQIYRDAAAMYRKRSDFRKMAEYLHRVLTAEPQDGASWAWLGYCYLMLDDIERSYIAYQQALYIMPPSEDPHIWYGLGLLYERQSVYGQAEQYLSQALQMTGEFDRRSDCTYRLGMVYKKGGKYNDALACFHRLSEQSNGLLNETVEMLTAKLGEQKLALKALQDRDVYTAENAALQGQIGATEAQISAVQSMADLWFQIGHTQELEGRYKEAKLAFEKVLKYNSKHATVLQKLGWLYHNISGLHSDPDLNVVQTIAIEYLERSVASRATDDAAWYLLGRCCMRQKDYKKAHNAYQQAVNLNDKEPTYWCSIGVLYYYNNQYHEALDTYARALQLNPELSEIWCAVAYY